MKNSKSTQTKQLLKATERIKLKGKFLRLIVYKLQNGEVGITYRQMAVAVKVKLENAKSFIRNQGIISDEVILPNRQETLMVPAQIAAQFWKELNQTRKGNIFTKEGQSLLETYLKSCGNN
jgi:ribosome maturation protein Sdo1